jgi:hypothetical protein
VLVDHVGQYLDVDQAWWRVPGRLAAPIFFFLIGYGRTREVPGTWIVLGLALTALDYLTNRSADDFQLNLLLSFALLRTFMPYLATHVAGVPSRMALAAGAGVALIPVLAPFLEYGAEGWLWALFGLSQRSQDGSSPTPAATGAGYLVAATAAVTYWATETRDFELESLQSATLAILVAGGTFVFLRFRRGDLPAVPGLAGSLLRLCGRRSLELYAASLAAMQLVGYAIHGPQGEDPDEDAS